MTDTLFDRSKQENPIEPNGFKLVWLGNIGNGALKTIILINSDLSISFFILEKYEFFKSEIAAVPR